MRLVCALLAICVFTPAQAAPAVTLVLQFDEAYSPQSLNAMKEEVSSIVHESGIKVDWRLLSDLRTGENFETVVVVRFRGTCSMQSAYEPDTRTYYAFTHVSDGAVLPFSEVECDKVGSSIRPSLSKSQWGEKDSILGRALGRVVAHELYHMVTKTRLHAGDGVTRSALSPAQLVSAKLRMTLSDLETLALLPRETERAAPGEQQESAGHHQRDR